MKIKNKVLAVTGAGSGIGRALVLQLVQQGASIAALDINEDALNETKDLAGAKKDRVSIHKVDVTDKYAVEAIPGDVLEYHGAVDGLINNAGIIQPFVKVADLDFEIIEKVVNVNFYGQVYMTKAFLPHLLKRDSAHIVNISSMGGFFPVREQTIYGASKAAVKLFSEGLYTELLDTNVAVSVVFPGAINTRITQNSDVTLDIQASDVAGLLKPLSPESAAKKIIKGMERNKFQIYIGFDSNLMNIFYRLNSLWATRFMYSMMKALMPD